MSVENRRGNVVPLARYHGTRKHMMLAMFMRFPTAAIPLAAMHLGALPAHGQAPIDRRKANAFEFAYSYLAPEFNLPSLCEKISPDAVLTAAWGGEGHQITFTRSACYYNLALKTGDASYCDHVQQATAPMLDGSAMTPENCRAAVAKARGLNSGGGDRGIILDILGFDGEHYFEPRLNGYLEEWGSPEFIARLTELPDFSKGEPDLDALRAKMRERHLRYERATVDSPQGMGKPKLLWATYAGDIDEMQRLLALGASPFVRDPRGNSLMHEAVSTRRIEIMALVVALGVNVDARDAYAGTALLRAANGGTTVYGLDGLSLDALLRLGADIEAADNRGMRALHWACTNPNPAAVDILLARGADPNAVDIEGDTPLLKVVRGFEGRGGERLRIVESLLCAGADINIRDRRGRTALDYVTSKDANPKYFAGIEPVRKAIEAHIANAR